MKIVMVAAMALVDTDGRVLLAQRPPGKSMAGMWEFPGGKIESGETPEACIQREMKEELGVVLCDRCFAPLTFVSHTYENFHLLMVLYRPPLGRDSHAAGGPATYLAPPGGYGLAAHATGRCAAGCRIARYSLASLRGGIADVAI